MALPSEVTSWITAIATATGASFAIWKWGVEERIRQSREMATLDGDISVTIIPADSSTVAVFIESVWNNKGTLPVFLHPKKCRIRRYNLSLDNIPEVIDPTDEEKEAHHNKVSDFNSIRRTDMFMLEPVTISRIQSSVLLPKGPLYEVRSYIETVRVGNRPSDEVRSYIETVRVGNRPSALWWFRRRIFNSNEATDKKDSDTSASGT